MKAYVHTLEAILATALLLAAYLFSVQLFYRDPAMGTQSRSDLRYTVYRVLDYLNVKGVLPNVTAYRNWPRLQMYLDKILLSMGIGYQLEIYNYTEPDGVPTAQRVGLIVSGYNENSPSKDLVVYLVYPPESLGGDSNAYLFIMKVSR